VEEAFWKAMDVARVGSRISAIGRQVSATCDHYGFSIVRELSGHGVGRRVHEAPTVPNYEIRRAKGILTDGLVITVEPIINAGSCDIRECKDGWTIRTADRRLAAHYEHTIIVTQEKPIIVTAAT
jgi:methionyl aminopeptidase